MEQHFCSRRPADNECPIDAPTSTPSSAAQFNRSTVPEHEPRSQLQLFTVRFATPTSGLAALDGALLPAILSAVRRLRRSPSIASAVAAQCARRWSGARDLHASPTVATHLEQGVPTGLRNALGQLVAAVASLAPTANRRRSAARAVCRMLQAGAGVWRLECVVADGISCGSDDDGGSATTVAIGGRFDDDGNLLDDDGGWGWHGRAESGLSGAE